MSANGNGIPAAAAAAAEPEPRIAAELLGEVTHVADVRARVQAAMARGRSGKTVSQATVAREIGTSAATLSLFLAGRYTGDNVAMAAKLERWLTDQGETAVMRELVPEAPAFFPTQTSAEIASALNYAQALGDMVAVMGVPGVGKSAACREHARSGRNVWVATMAAHTTGVVPVLRAICDALGIDKPNGASALAEAIAKKVSRSRGLLIIDEVHHVAPAALDAVRALHDETGIGMALVGSVDLAVKVDRMPQLSSRLGVRLVRKAALAEDVAALVSAWGIQDAERRREVVAAARRQGALRTATKVLKLATFMARSEGVDSPSAAHIRDAAATLSSRTTTTDSL